MIASIVRGWMTEVELFDRVQRDKHRDTRKETTAQQVLDILGVDGLGEMFDFQVPEHVLQEAVATLAASFDQDYWGGVVETTRRDMQSLLNQSVSEGWSIRKAAKEFAQNFGSEYDLKRSTLVARTEIPDALNKGHDMGIRQLAQEVPELEIGKEWLSVFATLSRSSHMALDGTVVPAMGTFELGGVQCTHPGHYVLPAKDRCNCLCTILSSFITKELGISGQDAQNTDASTQAEPRELMDELKENDRLNKIAGSFVKAEFKNAARKAFDALTVQKNEMLEALTSRTKGGLVSDSTADMYEKYLQLKKELEVAKKAMQKEIEANAKLTVKMLADEVEGVEFDTILGNGSRMRNVNTNVSKKVQAKVAKAEQFVASITDKRVYGKPKVKTRWYQLRKGQRAHHRGSVEQWAEFDADPNKASSWTGMFVDADDDVATCVHELVHSVEARNPKIKKLTNEFLKKRIERAGTKNVSMKSAYPNHGYRASEVGNEDGFGKAWPDKDDSAKHYAGKTYSNGHTEILTLGVELLYTDAKGFAMRDPEYFKFIVGVLNGTL